MADFESRLKSSVPRVSQHRIENGGVAERRLWKLCGMSGLVRDNSEDGISRGGAEPRRGEVEEVPRGFSVGTASKQLIKGQCFWI